MLFLCEIIDIKQIYSPSVIRTDLIKVNVNRDGLSETATELLSRLDDEIGNYFEKPDDDQQKLTMFFHPYHLFS